jgi:enolase
MAACTPTNPIDFQEFMIMPVSAAHFADAFTVIKIKKGK